MSIGLTRLQRDQRLLVHHHRISIVTRRIRYRLGSMNTASLVGSGRFFLSATLSRPVRCDRSPRWLEQLQQFDCVENGLLRRNHGATGGLDGRGGRWP